LAIDIGYKKLELTLKNIGPHQIQIPLCVTVLSLVKPIGTLTSVTKYTPNVNIILLFILNIDQSKPA